MARRGSQVRPRSYFVEVGSEGHVVYRGVSDQGCLLLDGLVRERTMAAKKSSEKHYAWTDFFTGGDVEVRKSANGTERRLVSNRTHIMVGDEVSQEQLGVDDEGWQSLLDGGSVRTAPVPDEVDDFTSPHRA